jgi:dTMP kinase
VHGRGDADKLEAESVEFHEQVRQAFRALAETDPRRYLVLDATRRPDEIAALVLARVESLFTPRRGALRAALPHVHIHSERERA